MERARLDFEGARAAIGAAAAGLLHDESQRIALVHKAQFALSILGRGRVDVNATLEDVEVEIGH